MVQIEIADPELALEILARFEVVQFSDSKPPTEDVCYRWIEEINLKIQQAMHQKALDTWKHLSSFERFYAEINEFGDVRINGLIWKPEWSKSYDSWIVAFPDNQGSPVPIDPIHFVKVHFNKDLEL